MSDRPTQRPNRGPAPLPGQKQKAQRSWRFYVAIGAAVIALVLIFQNSQDDDIERALEIHVTTAPLFFILIVVFALGALTGWLLPHVRRGRKKEKAEN